MNKPRKPTVAAVFIEPCRCLQCDYTCLSSKIMSEHVRAVHSARESRTCPGCGAPGGRACNPVRTTCGY